MRAAADGKTAADGLRLLRQIEGDGREFVSSTAIADELHPSPSWRKDLAVTGIEGKCRAGYPVSELIRAPRGLGWDNTTDAFAGAGSLGAALIGYEGFERHGLNIVAAFDIDDAKVGRPPVAGSVAADEVHRPGATDAHPLGDHRRAGRSRAFYRQSDGGLGICAI